MVKIGVLLPKLSKNKSGVPLILDHPIDQTVWAYVRVQKFSGHSGLGMGAWLTP